MRRVELEITDRNQVLRILDNTQTIRLGVIADDMPYIVPFVFGYTWDGKYPVFYAHCGMAGRKNQGLFDGAKICFEIDIEGPLMTTRTNLANNFSREFCCIMGEGTVSFAVDAEEKKQFFSHIMKKQTGKTDYEYQSGWLAMTKVFKIDVLSMSASQKGMVNAPKDEDAEGFSWDRESKDSVGAIFWN